MAATPLVAAVSAGCLHGLLRAASGSSVTAASGSTRAIISTSPSPPVGTATECVASYCWVMSQVASCIACTSVWSQVGKDRQDGSTFLTKLAKTMGSISDGAFSVLPESTRL